MVSCIRVSHVAQTITKSVHLTARLDAVYLPTLSVFASRIDLSLTLTVRLMLDTGATTSFISLSVALKLGLTLEPIAPVTVKAFGGLATLQVSHTARVALQSPDDPSVRDEVSLLVMTGVLIGKLPAPTEELHQLAREYGIHLSEKLVD